MNNQHYILQEYFPKLSKLEEEYMAKAMQRQKDGITKPQIVAGREFKGTSFISKPDKIIFKVTVTTISNMKKGSSFSSYYYSL